MSLPVEVNDWITPNANGQCLVCTFPYLQHLKIRYEEHSCKQIPKIILETAVKYEKRRKGFAFVILSTETWQAAVPCSSDCAVKSPLGTCLDWISLGWGGRVTLCALRDSSGAKALLAGLRKVDKIFLKPRLGSSTVPLVPFLPVCPRIQ